MANTNWHDTAMECRPGFGDVWVLSSNGVHVFSLRARNVVDIFDVLTPRQRGIIVTGYERTNLSTPPKDVYFLGNVVRSPFGSTARLER